MPLLLDMLPTVCAHHPCLGPVRMSFNQALCRKHLCPCPLPPAPISYLPQPHKHTLLTNVVELLCHFHLIMVMTWGGGGGKQPSQDQIQSKLISLAGDGNGLPLLATPGNPHTLGTAGCPREWEELLVPLCRGGLLSRGPRCLREGTAPPLRVSRAELSPSGDPGPPWYSAVLPAGCHLKKVRGDGYASPPPYFLSLSPSSLSRRGGHP